MKMKLKLLALLVPIAGLNFLLLCGLLSRPSQFVTGLHLIAPSGDCAISPRLYMPLTMKDYITYFEGPWEREPNNNYLQANGALYSGIGYHGYSYDWDDVFSFYMLVRGSITVDLLHNAGVEQLQLLNGLTLKVYTYTAPYRLTYLGDPGQYYIYVATVPGLSTSPYTLTVTYPTPPLVPTSSPPPTSTPCTPTATPTPTAVSWTGYRFEAGTQNWTTDEGDSKLAILDTTTEIVHSGSRALSLTTTLSGNLTDVYKRTHALAYFTNAVPEGMPSPGPDGYDLTGKLVSCFVHFPSGWASGGNPQVYARIFARDKEFDNEFSDPVDITPSNVGQWFQLSFTFVNDPPFDAGKTIALGVAIYLQAPSTFEHTGSIYIDTCYIEYP